ncbi:putative inorganic phosphate cotransporter [Pectinophora gossypiella]|uniref:putative inorganic phosphate cotransporter n=1 Tax=Pectinophora gossypiella TaxID=13191 RepID=UPI00214E3898|nr:putative inorganic phosphate cotransporter [Pectinophora gossypiella]
MSAQEITDFKKPSSTFGVRHFQALLLFLGMIFIFLMKVDMNIAIVAMTDSTQNNTFDWSHQRQSVILSSYKWGYLVTKIPGGELSARFGGKVVMVACGAVNCFTSMLLPIAGVYGGWQAVCACRLIQGLAQGLLLPTIHTLTGKWAPPDERSRISTAMYAGGQLGTALEYLMAGFVASYWGWQGIFYVNGLILAIWTAIYIVMGSASPLNSKSISAEERIYIERSLGQDDTTKELKTPWLAMLTSIPFLILIVTHVGNSWGYWTLLTELPTYLTKVLGFNIKANGIISALPYLAAFIMCFVFGFVSDYTLGKKYISVNACRKINNSIGSFGPALFLIWLSYVTSEITLAVMLLIVCIGLSSGVYAGFNIVHLDMAPNHAGTMIGISGFVSNVVSTFAPIAAGFMIKDETLSSEWRKVFFLVAGILIATNFLFLACGSTRKQKWNDLSK